MWVDLFGKIEVQRSIIKHFAHARTACAQQHASIDNNNYLYGHVHDCANNYNNYYIMLEFTAHKSPAMTPARPHHFDAGLHTPSLQCCRELVVVGFCRTKGGC